MIKIKHLGCFTKCYIIIIMIIIVVILIFIISSASICATLLHNV